MAWIIGGLAVIVIIAAIMKVIYFLVFVLCATILIVTAPDVAAAFIDWRYGRPYDLWYVFLGVGEALMAIILLPLTISHSENKVRMFFLTSFILVCACVVFLGVAKLKLEETEKQETNNAISSAPSLQSQ